MEPSYDGDEDDFEENFQMPHEDPLLAASSDPQRGFLAASFDLAGLRESHDPLAMSTMQMKQDPSLSSAGMPPPTAPGLDQSYLQRSEHAAGQFGAPNDIGDWEKDVSAMGDGGDLDPYEFPFGASQLLPFLLLSRPPHKIILRKHS